MSDRYRRPKFLQDPPCSPTLGGPKGTKIVIIISVYVCQCQARIYLSPYNMCQCHFFHCGMPPELGAQRKLGGGHAKKISDQKLQRDAWTNIFVIPQYGVCAPNFKTVSAPMVTYFYGYG